MNYRLALLNSGIYTIFYKNNAGDCKQFVYVDTKNKCVFEADKVSETGSIRSIQKIIDREKELSLQPTEKQDQRQRHSLRL
jgi:hypothetical protein